jgi:Ca2+-binding RTX toxin-like protein
LGIENITGSNYNDVLTGDGAANALSGASGNDTLKGGAGTDTLDGGTGNDRYWVDNALDAVIEAAGGGTDTVYASTSYALGSSAEVEVLRTINPAATTSINLTGSSIANTIIGNAGANMLAGKGGNDLLTGGLGKDTFVFNTALNASTNVDTIRDFSAADDTIRLENAVFTKLTTLGTLSSSAFELGTTAQDTTDRIIYDRSTGSLYYDADGTGAAAQVKFAILETKPAIDNLDFFVI